MATPGFCDAAASPDPIKSIPASNNCLSATAIQHAQKAERNTSLLQAKPASSFRPTTATFQPYFEMQPAQHAHTFDKIQPPGYDALKPHYFEKTTDPVPTFHTASVQTTASGRVFAPSYDKLPAKNAALTGYSASSYNAAQFQISSVISKVATTNPTPPKLLKDSRWAC